MTTINDEDRDEALAVLDKALQAVYDLQPGDAPLYELMNELATGLGVYAVSGNPLLLRVAAISVLRTVKVSKEDARVEILRQRVHQNHLWPEWDPVMTTAVLMEECGEVGDAWQRMTHTPRQVQVEAVQVAALTMRVMEQDRWGRDILGKGWPGDV